MQLKNDLLLWIYMSKDTTWGLWKTEDFMLTFSPLTASSAVGNIGRMKGILLGR